MTINFDKGDNKPKEIVPAKNHVARLYSIVEIGLVPNPFFGKPTNDGGTNTKEFNKVARLTWELPNETREFDGVKKPMVIGKDFTLSTFHGATLRKVLNGMLGGLTDEDADSLDLRTLLGKECLLQTGIQKSKANGNEYAIIISASQLPEGLKAPKQFNETVYLDYSEGWDDEVYEKLPQFIKDKMAESKEWKRRFQKETSGGIEYPAEDIDPDDVPF